MLSPNVFKVLGVEPLLGHGFTASSSPDSVILSYTLWRLLYASNPHIIGKTVEVNGKANTVIGVMPRGFEFDYEKTLPQIWIPIKLTAADYTRSRRTPAYGVIARLRSGVTARAAQAVLMTSMKVLRSLYSAPARRDRARVSVRSYASTVKSARNARALLLLFAATGVLWLIACVNAMNPLLAHGTARGREISTRCALGAGRLRILQQLLVEAILLSAIAALLGAGIAEAAIHIFSKAMTARLGLWHPVALNLPVLGGLATLTTATALLASIWPAAVAASAPIEPALRQSGHSGVSRRRYRLRAALVVAQIAMSLVLLVSCGLLLRTLFAMRHVPLGFRTDHIVVAHLVTPMYRYAHKDITYKLYEPLLERVRHLPGVQAAGMMSEVPLGTTARFGIRIDSSSGGEKKQIVAQLKIASRRLEKIFGFRILAGRYFDAGDTRSSRPVVVVNRAFAQRYSPDPNDPSKVLGMRLISLQKGKPDAVIVGVLDDVHQDSIERSGTPVMEIPLTQLTPEASFYHLEAWGMDLAIRTHQRLQSFLPELRKVLKQEDPALANSKLETMNRLVANSYGGQSLVARVLEVFGAIAFLLCMSGVYGLLAYIVTQQRQEIGVRIALGASKRAVV